jgi:hypothetical protein
MRGTFEWQSIELLLDPTAWLIVVAFSVLGSIGNLTLYQAVRQGVDLMLVGIHEDVRELLEQSGALEKIGAENLHLRPIDGVLAYLELSPETEETVEAALADSVNRLVTELTTLLEEAVGEKGAEPEVK